MKKHIVFLLSVTGMLTAHADRQTLRYQGLYTLGHEVNTFCPVINSQCYWLSPDTLPLQRQKLKQLVEENTSKPYEAICVVVEGKINQDPEAKNSIGFAVNYAGLFTITMIYGLCTNSHNDTQDDL